ncbi:uncharacterized protein LOC101237079 isoform X4 [Hydra vulgaris]|uniref:Uncharacterized protein LOC101237079 isoform X4 n=1 Tax=Hydra vulgaris TaxID=6087 RepID=A0ABM4BIY8_HYDVU
MKFKAMPRMKNQIRAPLNSITINKKKKPKMFSFPEIKDNGLNKILQQIVPSNQQVNSPKEKLEFALSPLEKTDSTFDESTPHLSTQSLSTQHLSNQSVFVHPSQVENKYINQSFQDNFRNKGDKPHMYYANGRIPSAPNGYCFDFWNKGACKRSHCRYEHQHWNSENGGNNEERLKKSAPSDLNMSFNILERSEEKIAHLKNMTKESNWVTLNNVEKRKYQFLLERSLLTLNDSEKNISNAGFAYECLRMMKSIDCLKENSLYYCAKIQAESGIFERAFELLKEFWTVSNKTKSFDEIKKKWEEVFLICIDSSGRLFDHWEFFKSAAINSDKIMNKIFAVVDLSIIETKFKIDELTIFQKNLINGTLFLAEASLTKFLKLYSPAETIKNVVDLLKVLPNLSILPIVTVEKLLTSIYDFNDAETRISILNRLPTCIAMQCSISWNALVVECCQKGSDFLQVAEQLYGIMKAKDVKTTPECSIHLLNSLCAAGKYDSFVKRIEDFEQNNIFQDFKTPGWFAESLAKFLNIGGNLTFIFKIVMLLLTSPYQPEEQIVLNVLDGLIASRKFSDIFELVKKCFQCSVILSQRDLRRIIYYLEEWTSKPDASIEIYALTRKMYPRPADYWCIKCSKIPNNPIPSMRSSSSTPQASSLTRELNISPSSLNDGFESVENNEMDVDYYEKPIKKLLPDLTLACSSGNVHLLSKLFYKIMKSGKSNDRSVVEAIFLGISMCENNYDLFQINSNVLINDRLDDSALMTVGQVGVRLIKSLLTFSKFQEAYNVLHFLDQKCIPYIRCGKAFGIQIHTSIDLSECDVLLMCCKVCTEYNDFESGYNLFEQNVLSNNIYVSESEYNEINETASSIIYGLCKENFLELSWQFHNELVNSSYPLSSSIQEKVLNEMCAKCFLKNASFSEEVYKYMQNNNLDVYSITTRTYLEYLMNNDKENLAQEIFEKCLKGGFYKINIDPLCLEISCDFLKGEISLFVKHHFKKLALNTSQLGTLKLRCVPSEKKDLFNINKSQSDCKLNILQILNDFSPQLDIKDSNEYVEISIVSIRRWYHSQLRFQKALCPLITSKQRFVDMPTSEKVSFIEDGKPNMKMTICPTPQYGVTSDAKMNDANERTMKLINSEIQKQCTKLMDAQLLPRENYINVSRILYRDFIDLLNEEGNLFDNEEMANRVISYVNDNFNR